MANLKFSRQRAAIKEYLSSTLDHPTADTVYLHIREEFPNISLGTVYRNLNLLADMGEAVKISTPDGGDRFDGCTAPHYHVVCQSCGRVFDLKVDERYMQEMNELADRYFEGSVAAHTALFYGICKDCGGS
ncbi:MAG: transcriptional repressor [Lachnospiraceae bacterium]